MTTTLASRATTDNSPVPLRLVMEKAARRCGMKDADSFEQFLIGRGDAVGRLEIYQEELVAGRHFGRARLLADRLAAPAEGGATRTVDECLHPATISDAAEECAESQYRMHRDKMSRRRFMADVEKEISDKIELFRALRAEDAAERALEVHG